ncbi:unnamed protein product, partial [marine sediment metagenome]
KSDFLKALDCLNKALEIDPNYAEAMSRLGYVHMRLEFKKLPMKEVFNLCKKAIELNPTSPVTWNTMGNVYYKKKEFMNWEKKGDKYRKKNRFEEAIEINSKYHLAWNWLSVAYNKNREYEKAMISGKKALKLKPEDPTYIANLGRFYADKGDYNTGIDLCEKSLKIDSNYKHGWNKLGFIYNKKGDYEKAIEMSKKALEIDVGFSWAWNIDYTNV